MADVVDKIAQIPGIMDKMGWNVAASLMRKWFSGPSSNNRDAQQPDLTSVNMDWLLQTPRTRKVYDSLIRDRIWINRAAQAELRSDLRIRALSHPATTPFGNLSAPPPLVDKTYINYRAYNSGLTDPLDDVFGALGSFTYHVAAEGNLIQNSLLPAVVSIDKVGVYVHDSYDFEDDHWHSQPLGFWNFDKGHVSILPLIGYEGVYNKTFREYRARYNKGGDFWVYSDIKIIRRHPPDTFQATFYA